MLGSYQREAWIFRGDIWINWAFPAARKQKTIGDAWSKLILKQRHQQRNMTAWKDRVQSAVHIYKVILSATPTYIYCLFFLKVSDNVP